MFSRLDTIAIQGTKAIKIDVQVHIASGSPCFIIVGLPDKTIAESKERVRAAISSIGIQFPQKRIVVNLSPADLFKEGTHYDLAIALGIIATTHKEIAAKIKNYIFMGELSLDGKIMHVSGVLPASIKAKENSQGIVCSIENVREALFSCNTTVIALSSLKELLEYLKGGDVNLNYDSIQISTAGDKCSLDMDDICGQKIAKRGLIIAAAGRHNVLMRGPPGTGKTMLAKRLMSISPNLSNDEIMTINMISSITGSFNTNIKTSRPFREPHHSCSMAAMIGGGKFAKPGEITLAHKGILFLDELPEFSKQVLDALRQPLEAKSVTVSRVNAKCTYPADFQLVAAMNPCRCGHFGDIKRMCKKAPACTEEYLSKISGPFLDRIDINIKVSSIDPCELENKTDSETSTTIKNKVMVALSAQDKRYKECDIKYNSEAEGTIIDELFYIENDAKALLNNALKNNYLSIRGYKKILRVARTIADLKDMKNVSKDDISEALHYRLYY